jgi:hypothetical protein
LHHVTADLLREAFYALKRTAAPGVDGLRWADYEAELEENLQDLHARVQRGAYRALPVEDLDLIACPAECHGALGELILARSGLAVVFDLRGTGLAHVDHSAPT